MRRTLGAGIRAFSLVALAALAGGGLFALFSGSLVRVEPDLLRDLQVASLVGLASFLLYPLLPFQALVEAQQRGYVVQLLSLAQSVVTTAMALLLARAGMGITGQLIALTAGVMVFRLGLAASGARQLAPLGPLLERPDAETWRAIRGLNIPTFLTAMAGRVGFHTDNIIVGLMLGPSHVTMLFLTQRLAGVAGTQLLGVGNASWAALAELHALGRRETFNARLLDLTRLVSGLAVAALVPIAVYNRHFVYRWVGAANYAGDVVTLLVCVNAFLLAVQSLWGWCFGGTGKMPVFTPIAVAGALINVFVSVVATPIIGLAGPLVGTLVGVSLSSLWALPVRLKQHFGTDPGALARAAAMPLLWGVPIGALLYWLARIHEPPGWLGLLGEMALAALLLLVCWWNLALNDEDRAAFRERVRIAFAR